MAHKDTFTKSPTETGTLREGLLAWFGANSRKLPWREKYVPYQVWISEIMLQQTRVKTMLPYYHRWMARFPDAASIARASEDEVPRFWEGLGYYARAGNIGKAARIMVSDYGGEVPPDFDLLRRLPGIGRYTAGAIMSFAFNADYPAADANAGRIFARLLDIDHPSGSKEFAESVWRAATDLLPRGRSREFNQALMDLGSMVCSAKEPSCAQCPVSGCCIAFRKGLTALRPVKARKATVTQIVRAAVVMVLEGRVLVRKRPESGLMPHLWELPGGEVPEGSSPEQAIRRIWAEELCIRLGPLESLGVIKHSHTAFRVMLHAFLCDGCGPASGWAETGPRLRWVSIKELEKPAFPSAHRRIIRAFLERLAASS
ncbi:MAG: A/G-specific adenine glycosylase [Syntrophobacteraceae bacterium]|nr:A/G-specific adenine glycosylase [Syntrophobacteraceae bacterium]